MTKLLSICFSFLVLAGCSSGDGGTVLDTYQYKLAGNYSFSTLSFAPRAVSGTFTLEWNEVAGVITGAFTDTGIGSGVSGTVTGTVATNARQIIVTFASAGAGGVKSLEFVATFTAGGSVSGNVVAKDENGATLDTTTYTATLTIPDDDGGGNSLSCTGTASGDLAADAYVKGCRYYTRNSESGNNNCPDSVGTPINVGVDGDGGLTVIDSEDELYEGALTAAPTNLGSGRTMAVFAAPDNSDPNRVVLNMYFDNQTPEVPDSIMIMQYVSGSVARTCKYTYQGDI